jgi:rhamnopyranosyl-N-acetylglucosaminyl-diphospho-decaprenol beta-1,3/1,4-galactofuranosyltransferase
VSGKVISIVVLTHNRHELLRRCVNDVLLRTSEKTREIVIWDNGSDDGTREYLEGLTDRRIRVVRSPENLGMNAYGRAFGLATQDYLIELDDDVIEAPARWDETLLEAFLRLPKIGYLAASLVDDPNDSASRYLTYLREQRNAYTRRELNGVAILEGPTGGSCTMTSRELYNRVGGFKQNTKFVYWREDAAYVKALKRLGYGSAVLESLSVWHAGGPYYSKPIAAKNPLYIHEARVRARKDFVKRLILRVPFAAELNARYDWFDPPHQYEPPAFGENRS